ncbi:lysophospholipid acyltransferase family protein [Laceyella putida]|uniref:1-acyl-sn-glycerol-3-phosphate acyltransferase n=1 Tax=Laceyella putida TaxID=110101 RepID=A0ABW2RMT7_9BACL
MLYTLIRGFARFLLNILYRVEVKGERHIPTQGPVVLCANHISNFDPPLVGAFITRQIHFMAKDELFRIPILARFLRELNAFPVKRGAGDSAAVKNAIRLLRDGQMLGIFPEGTRSKTGELGKAHIGAALIALKGKAPIVPVAIIGPYRLFRPVKMVIGQPIDVTPYTEGKVSAETANELTDLVMHQIQQMLNEHR